MKTKSKKVLIIRPGAIGDVVHTTVIAQSIKNSHPDWTVDYLTQCEIAPILENNPYIDNIHKWDRKQRKSWKYIFQTGSELFKKRYDIVFCLTNSIINFILAIMACPQKIGIRKNTNKSWVEDFFYSAKSIIKDIELPDNLILGIDDEQYTEIEKRLNGLPKPYMVIIPGGGTDKNRQGRIWDIKNWKSLSEKLIKEYGGTVIVCGSKGEQKYHEGLAGENILITSGDYNLSGTNALLSKADIVISGDTGTLHMASAHNIKTLALLGSTSPDKIKPYGQNGYYISANTDCKYCWQKKCKHLTDGEKYTPCMEKITTDMVINKVREILN